MVLYFLNSKHVHVYIFIGLSYFSLVLNIVIETQISECWGLRNSSSSCCWCEMLIVGLIYCHFFMYMYLSKIYIWVGFECLVQWKSWCKTFLVFLSRTPRPIHRKRPHRLTWLSPLTAPEKREWTKSGESVPALLVNWPHCAWKENEKRLAPRLVQWWHAYIHKLWFKFEFLGQ